MDSVSTLLGYGKVALQIMVILTFLVAVHELGHYWVARLCGMKVDAFAVMMGGVRKGRDLEARLKKPIVPSSRVWAVIGIASLVTAVSGVEKWVIPYTLGLAALAIPIPIWVVSRLGALYHLDPAKPLATLLKCTVGAVLLLFLGTRQAHSLQTILGMMFFGGLLAIGFVYYHPVLNKPEDSKQGEGEIVIDGEKVSVPFRPVASTRSKSGTEFSMLLLPLGGFVMIHANHPKDDGSEVNVEGGFYSKGAFARLMVLFAGPLFSLLLGIVLLSTYFTVSGVPVENPKPIVGVISKDRVGPMPLKEGDVILEAKGQAVKTTKEFQILMRGQDASPVPLTIQRGAETLNLEVEPFLSKDPLPVFSSTGKITDELKRRYILGINFKPEIRAASVGESVKLAMTAPIAMVKGLADLVKKPAEAKDNVGGVASMVAATQETAKDGWFELVRLAGLLSMSLGIMNLLPIHPLDGGQMTVALIELFRGNRRLSMSTQNKIASVGMLLIISLTLFTLMADIGRFAGK